jgi:short-subunit dehydrogenase
MEANKQRALVTGASSGFGVEMARVLAKRGLDLVIAARRRERLEALATELRQAHSIDVVVLTADLSAPAGPQKLFDDVRTAGLKIDVLVNNAGLGRFGLFLDQSLAEIQELIAVDVLAVTVLTRLFAQWMKEQGGGYILQVSSFAALQPIPRYSVYSGAKAYLIAMAQALVHELRHTGVSISVVAPGFMSTEFHDVSGHKWTLWMKIINLPIRYAARSAIRGMFRRKLLITPGLFYQIVGFFLRFTPRWLASSIAGAISKN